MERVLGIGGGVVEELLSEDEDIEEDIGGGRASCVCKKPTL